MQKSLIFHHPLYVLVSLFKVSIFKGIFSQITHTPEFDEKKDGHFTLYEFQGL